MSLTIQLLGRPEIRRPDGDSYRIRGRKSWALLAYLLLTDRPQSRHLIASLLFENADDPLRALRWSVSEVRKALAGEGDIDGDPLELKLAEEALVDVGILTTGSWHDAIRLQGLGKDLLEGFSIRDAAAFDTWLLSERSHIRGASEAILHEAALSALSAGELHDAIDYATRVVAMNPLEENHQALLIRAYRTAGDYQAANHQLRLCTELFARELGVAPGPAITSAASSPLPHPDAISDIASIRAILEAGSAAVSVGAVEPGINSLRTGVTLADLAGDTHLRVTARLSLAEALIHSLRGENEEGTTFLHQANQIAEEQHEPSFAIAARVELGYVDFLRARYDRARQWLQQAVEQSSTGEPTWTAKANTYLGAVFSDQADYPRAISLLDTGAEQAARISATRVEAYARAMLGRAHLLRGAFDEATDALSSSIDLAEEDRWLAFLPWPQAFLAEAHLGRQDTEAAAEILEQAFARACQIGDPCWEGVTARGLALVAAAANDIDRAFRLLDDARSRCNRLDDTYMWLDAYILDSQCQLGLINNHPRTEQWIATMSELAARTGMMEMTVRALLHRSHLGEESAATLASVIGAEIDSPALQDLLAQQNDQHSDNRVRGQAL